MTDWQALIILCLYSRTVHTDLSKTDYWYFCFGIVLCSRSRSAPGGLDMEEDFLLIGQDFRAVLHEVNMLRIY